MKRFSAAVAFMAAAVSCSYYTYPVEVERGTASVTGLDLDGRVVSVSFVHSGESDSLHQSIAAEKFALGLEKNWFDGNPAIDLFAIRNSEGADYASRDTLVQLAVSTDADVAFLFDEPEYLVNDGDTTHLRMRLYAYDCLGKDDKVLAFYGTRGIKGYPAGNDASWVNGGTQLAWQFNRSWRKESYNVYYFEEYRWTEAVTLAEDMKWEDAMKIWLDIAGSTRNSLKQAVASYNIALSCYMLGNEKFALAWLDKADSITELGQSKWLRKRLTDGE